LRDSEQFNRVVLERSPLGISVRSRTGRLLSYNAAWMRIWQTWKEDLIDYTDRHRPKLEFDHRDSYLGEWLPRVRDIYENGGYLHIPELDLRHSRKGGERWLSQHFYAIRDLKGEVDRVVIITEDITQRKKAEVAVQAATREKYEQVKNIAGGFAHEIRNALFPAEGALYRLSQANGGNGDGDGDNTDERWESYTQSATEAICRAIDITEMISQFTKLESERMPEVVDVNAVIDEVLAANKLRLEDMKVSLERTGSGEALVVSNHQQFYSVVNNLLLNSLDALTNRPQPSILVAVDRAPHIISVSLRDNGHGISEKDLSKVFDAFFSSKPSRGTGLGLATARKIVEMYDGTITVSSEQHRWTQMHIVLRAASNDDGTSDIETDDRDTETLTSIERSRQQSSGDQSIRKRPKP
ncbi:PAS domain S-box protein, partial [candidate division GN15 bacterium]|nr:PAS domain S-box protein [candidate division GN15 bacterium]